MKTRILNRLGDDVTLQTGHHIPDGGFIDVDGSVVVTAMKHPGDARLFRQGFLKTDRVPVDEPEPVGTEFTRETIAAMDYRELKSYLKDLDLDTSGTADDLRDRLTKHVFIDL